MIIDTKHKLIEKINDSSEKREDIIAFYNETREMACRVENYKTEFIDRNDDEIVDFFADKVDFMLTMLKTVQDDYPEEAKRLTHYGRLEMTLNDMVSGLENLEGDALKYAKQTTQLFGLLK